MVVARTSEAGWDAVRYQPDNGKAWALRSGKWLELVDKSPGPQGRYEVQLITLTNDWGAIRLETESGKAWTLNNLEWIPIGD